MLPTKATGRRQNGLSNIALTRLEQAVKTGRRSTSPGAVLKASPVGFRKLG